MQNTPKRKYSEDKKISQEIIAEVRNALQIILSVAQLQLMKRKADMVPDTRTQLQEIVNQVDRIDRLLPR